MCVSGIMITLSLLVSFLCAVILVDAEKELIFNANCKIFDHITKPIDQCFTACPAETDDQEKFNQDESITKNSLFLRDSIDPPSDHDTSLRECENIHEPSILFRVDYERFEIGYEVYFNKEKMKGNELSSPHKSVFYTIDQMHAYNKEKKLKNRMLGYVSRGFGSITSIFKSSKSKQSQSQYEYEYGNDLTKLLRFFWLGVFRFYFDVDQCGPIRVVYSVDLGDLNAAYACKDYKADEALYKKVDFKSIYDQTNQEKLFENLPDFPNKPDGKCGQEYGCLKPHQLIPHYYYHSQASKITTCSAVNTIPVWESISDGMLKKIDQYLYVISQIWGTDVTITTGVADILSYRTGKRNRYGKKISRKLFMDLIEQKVPVPGIIYKIVKFWRERYDIHVLIVIHNDPLATEKNHVCPQDERNSNHKDLLDSWDFVVNETAEFGLSYPCLMEKEVLDRLKVNRNQSRDWSYLPFFLSQLPVAFPMNKELTIDEKKQMIRNKAKELFGDET